MSEENCSTVAAIRGESRECASANQHREKGAVLLSSCQQTMEPVQLRAGW